MYLDKLDGEITGEFYREHKQKSEREIEQVSRQIEAHDAANLSYLDAGVNLIELAGKAGELYARQTLPEKRRLLELFVSNSVYEDGSLTANFREPFDYIAEINTAYVEQTARKNRKKTQTEIWLPTLDSFRTKYYQDILDLSPLLVIISKRFEARI